MASDSQIVLAASRFEETAMHLRDFSKVEMPMVAKITKGQHSGVLGVPSLSSPNLCNTALFLNAGKNFQIVAQPIKMKEGKKSSSVGSKIILIPDSYNGFFELLSEEGRSTKPFESVLELSRRRNIHEKVIVRETFVIRSNNTNKTLNAGEILTPISDDGKFLQCRTSKNQLISLPLDCKAKFSPLAKEKEDSISGVHTVKNLLKKRMPLIVRLIHGMPPKGLKSSFVPEFRLLGFIEVENNIFALPLQKDIELISIPLNTKLKMQCVKNISQLENFTEFKRLVERSMRHLQDVKSRLQVIDLKLYDKDGNNKKESVLITESLLANGYVLKKSTNPELLAETKSIQPSHVTAYEYDEIDQIYDYVRGLTSLPKNLNNFESLSEASPKLPHSPQKSNNELRQSSSSSKVASSHKRENHHLFNSDSWIKHDLFEKPIPPSLKTIPSKKQLTQKRPTLIFSRSSNSHGAKISSPQKESNDLSPQSPLFHIRYKGIGSLSNLQTTSDVVVNSPSQQRAPSSKPQHVIHNTYSFKNFNSHDKNYELKKSSSTGTTNLKKYDTLDSSTSSNSKVHERSRSVNLGIFDVMWHKKSHKNKNKYYDRTLYL
ncbi:uncharacterized protein sano [Chironomus tepperi]|uniref:uncharacterized protein sano n=1 Tax=Chironomus tepperi TaxID=113505 RepID=UPI00391F76BF